MKGEEPRDRGRVLETSLESELLEKLPGRRRRQPMARLDADLRQLGKEVLLPSLPLTVRSSMVKFSPRSMSSDPKSMRMMIVANSFAEGHLLQSPPVPKKVFPMTK